MSRAGITPRSSWTAADGLDWIRGQRLVTSEVQWRCDWPRDHAAVPRRLLLLVVHWDGGCTDETMSSVVCSYYLLFQGSTEKSDRRLFVVPTTCFRRSVRPNQTKGWPNLFYCEGRDERCSSRASRGSIGSVEMQTAPPPPASLCGLTALSASPPPPSPTSPHRGG